MWLEWTPRAFERAKFENKPVLLSLVTAWSEGCAEMDRATYAHPQVGSLIDARFIAVRVDADRRPDLNDRYNLGGWPTTAFLTPSGDVLSGGTYLSAGQMLSMLPQVADAYRTRAAEIEQRTVRLAAERAEKAAHHAAVDAGVCASTPLDRSIIDHVRSLLVDQFDRAHGGFGSSPKAPHPHALLLALSITRDADDRDLSQVIDVTLDRMSALAGSDGGFHRYARHEDWSGLSVEKTLEDNAALLHVYVEAVLSGRATHRDRIAALVRWVRRSMSDESGGGFYNAQTSTGVDTALYVDRNAMMAGALIRAAALFDDIWLRDCALKALETVAFPLYIPGDGVGHVRPTDGAGPVRGLLTDQVHVASALIWAHAATGQLPYSMLAAELVQYAVRQMWNDAAGNFRDRVDARDPVIPFDLNCHAACVLDRLAILTGEQEYHDRARRILQSLAGEYRERDLFGAPFALAIREVVERQPPAGLELTRVDWQLPQRHEQKNTD